MTLIDVENIIKELNNIDLTKNYTKKTFLEIVNEKCRNHMKKKTKSTDDKKLTNYNQ